MRGVETIYTAFLMGIAVIVGIGFIIVWSYLSSNWADKQQFEGWAGGYRPVFVDDQMVLPNNAHGTPGDEPTLIGYCLAYRTPEGGIVYSCPGVMPNMTFSSQSTVTTVATTSWSSTAGINCVVQRMSDGSVVYNCRYGS